MPTLLKYKKVILATAVIIVILTGSILLSRKYSVNQKNDIMNIKIYSIELCPLCEQVKQTLPNRLKDKFGNSVNIEIINVDEQENEVKYNELITSIDNLRESDKNKFPVIDVEGLFIVIGYDYYYDSEIVNDIIRMNKGEQLGIRLEKSRYIGV